MNEGKISPYTKCLNSKCERPAAIRGVCSSCRVMLQRALTLKKITREEGINLVKKFDHEFPQKYFIEFLDYVNCNEYEFFNIINKNRSPHLWYKNKNKWNLKHKIY